MLKIILLLGCLACVASAKHNDLDKDKGVRKHDRPIIIQNQGKIVNNGGLEGDNEKDIPRSNWLVDRTKILERLGYTHSIDEKGTDKETLLKQKFILDVLLNVNGELLDKDLIELGHNINIADIASRDADISDLLQRAIPKEQEFNPLNPTHLRQLISLYKLFVQVKDWETFKRVVCFARLHLNGTLFTNALLLAVKERADTSELVIPAVQEILPELFIDTDVLRKAQNLDISELITETLSIRPNLNDLIGLGRITAQQQGSIRPIIRPWGIPIKRTWQEWKQEKMEKQGLFAQKIGGTGKDDKVIITMPGHVTEEGSSLEERISYLTKDLGLNNFMYNLALNSIRKLRVSGNENVARNERPLISVNDDRITDSERDIKSIGNDAIENPLIRTIDVNSESLLHVNRRRLGLSDKLHVGAEHGTVTDELQRRNDNQGILNEEILDQMSVRDGQSIDVNTLIHNERKIEEQQENVRQKGLKEIPDSQWNINEDTVHLGRGKLQEIIEEQQENTRQKGLTEIPDNQWDINENTVHLGRGKVGSSSAIDSRQTDRALSSTENLVDVNRADRLLHIGRRRVGIKTGPQSNENDVQSSILDSNKVGTDSRGIIRELERTQGTRTTAAEESQIMDTIYLDESRRAAPQSNSDEVVQGDQLLGPRRRIVPRDEMVAGVNRVERVLDNADNFRVENIALKNKEALLNENNDRLLSVNSRRIPQIQDISEITVEQREAAVNENGEQQRSNAVSGVNVLSQKKLESGSLLVAASNDQNAAVDRRITDNVNDINLREDIDDLQSWEGVANNKRLQEKVGNTGLGLKTVDISNPRLLKVGRRYRVQSATANAPIGGDIQQKRQRRDLLMYMLQSNPNLQAESSEDIEATATSRRQLPQLPANLLQSRAGELYINNIRELLARVNLERLSNLLQDTLPKSDVTLDEKYLQKSRSRSKETLVNQSILTKYANVVNNLYAHDKQNQQYENIKHILRSLIDKELPRAQRQQLQSNDLLNIIGSLLLTRLGANELQAFENMLELTNPDSVPLNLGQQLNEPLILLTMQAIVDLVDEYKQSINPLAGNQILPQLTDIRINNIKIDKLQTFCESVDSDLINALQLDDKLESPATIANLKKSAVVRQLRLNHKDFSIKLELTSDKIQNVLVRILLGPKIDITGINSNNNNLKNFVLLDAFPITLDAGRNNIKRKSKDINWTGRDTTTFAQLYKNVLQAINGELNLQLTNLANTNCRFPHNLLLPRGLPQGLRMQILVIVTPQLDGDDSITRTNLNEQICGMGMAALNSEGLPFGLDLERELKDANKLNSQNVFLKDVLIYHFDQLNE